MTMKLMQRFQKRSSVLNLPHIDRFKNVSNKILLVLELEFVNHAQDPSYILKINEFIHYI